MTDDPDGGESTKDRRLLDPEEVQRFIDATKDKFEGVTQANPSAPDLPNGWWKPIQRASAPGTAVAPSRVHVDYPTYLFGSVRIGQDDEALRHFDHWHRRIVGKTARDIIQHLLYPVQVIGGLLSPGRAASAPT